MAKVGKIQPKVESVITSSDILLQMKRSISNDIQEQAKIKFNRIIQCIRTENIDVVTNDTEFINNLKIQIIKGLIC